MKRRRRAARARSVFRVIYYVTAVLSMLVGLLISIIQAATQIHEQTLTFVPKLLLLALILIATGPWLLESLMDFTTHIFDLMLE